MKKWLLLVIAFSVVSAPLFAETSSYGLEYSLVSGIRVDVDLLSSLNERDLGYVEKAVEWDTWSWAMLGGNVVALILTFTLDDPIVGGILGILTLGGWSATQGMSAFAYRDLAFDRLAEGRDYADVTWPYYAHIGAASFGMGAVTAIGLSFDDNTGTAVVLAGVCSTISWGSGIFAILRDYSLQAENQ